MKNQLLRKFGGYSTIKAILLCIGLFAGSTSDILAQSKPQITTEPTNQTATVGATVIFQVVAAGGPWSYQWLKDSANLGDDSKIAGSATATLTVANAQTDDQGQYSVRVFSATDQTFSQPAQLTVKPAGPEAPVITQQPTNQTATVGQTVELLVQATGKSLVYQWVRDGNAVTNGGRFSGATTNRLVIQNSQTNDSANYWVVVTVAGAPDLKATSDQALLKVNLAAPNLPQVTQQPNNQTKVVGQTATFSVQAQGSNLQYQWRFNGTDIFSSTDSSLVLTDVRPKEGGDYSVFVSNGAGSVVSSNATLAVLCTFSITPGIVSLSVAGGSGSVFITADDDCAWTTTQTNSWITITSSTNGNGNGSISYLVATNLSTTSRTGVLTIAGRTFTIKQAAREIIKPTVAIITPVPNARLTNAAVMIRGKASDNVSVAAVECRLENMSGIGSYQTSSGTLNWSNSFSGLMPGTNTVRVRARDTSGNLSQEVTRSFFYSVTSPITLITNSPGSGIIRPGFRGTNLEIGRNYTVTAIPLGNNVFSNWTGTISNTSATLTFLMQSNMVLQANFVTNPFTVVQGIYNGIFSVPTGVTEETAGMVSDFNVTSKGTYSGRLLINGGIYGLAGSFDVWGHANNVIPRPPARGGRLVVDMNVLWQAFPRQIIGTVSGTNGGPWTADPLHLVLNSAATNSADYTMLIPPAANAPLASPGGYGFALITNKASKLFLVGTLADGTAFSQIVSLNEVNGAPLYANLYRNTGLLLGWLNFDSGSFTNGDQIPVGDIAWIKKAVHSRGSYTNGFTNVVSLLGSRWRKPTNGIPALPFTTNNPGILEIQGGNGIDLTNQVAISSNKNSLVKLTTPDYSTNSLSGSIDPKTGLLKVTFGNGHGKATTTGTGAVLQTTTNAAGFFLGTNQSGTILLEGN